MDNLKYPGNILDIFEPGKVVKIAAPMVRYSKLQFRDLVRNYGCDLCYTPMILADSICKSSKARNNEFSTNRNDSPLITQFAANTVHDFVGASYLVSPFCDGVDLNCGCPQRWAKQMGLGCKLLEQPELIYDMTRQCRNRISKPFTVSVKMRLCKDLRKTVEICRQLENSHISFLAVHARTPDHNTGDIDENALKLIAENVGVPVIANGGVKSLDECYKVAAGTKCQGVMVANALLTNPTLFMGTKMTTMSCVQDWVDICYNSTLNSETYCCDPRTIPEKPPNLTFQCFHHHLVFMLEKLLDRKQKRIFNNLQLFKDVLDFLEENFSITPQLFGVGKFHKYSVLNLDYKTRDDMYTNLKSEYNSDISDGKFFKDFVDDNNCEWSNIFNENGT